MAIYPYRCPKCGVVRDEYSHKCDGGKSLGVVRCECGEVMVRDYNFQMTWFVGGGPGCANSRESPVTALQRHFAHDASISDLDKSAMRAEKKAWAEKKAKGEGKIVVAMK